MAATEEKERVQKERKGKEELAGSRFFTGTVAASVACLTGQSITDQRGSIGSSIGSTDSGSGDVHIQLHMPQFHAKVQSMITVITQHCSVWMLLLLLHVRSHACKPPCKTHSLGFTLLGLAHCCHIAVKWSERIRGTNNLT